LKLFDYVKTIASQDRPLKFLLAKILIRTKLSPFLTIKYQGYRLRFYPSSTSRGLWIDNTEPEPVFDFFLDYLRKNDIIIDAGANIGTMTLGSSLIVGSKGKVYSIEPHPRTFNFLKGNILLNRFTNIETFNVALGSSSGNISFSNKKSDDQNAVVMNENGTSVPIRRLDELIDSNNIALLKIDVEGYEKFVLMGTTKLFKYIECVIVEVWAKAKYDSTPDSVYDILLDNNFQLFRFSGIREISPITRNYQPIDLGTNGILAEDILAIKNTDNFLLRTNYKIIEDK
jgi:FkbM family methyltransferase